MIQHIKQFSLSALCRILKVSRSGYYAWVSRPVSARLQANQRLLDRLKSCFEANRRVYGVRRLTAALQQQGESVNHKRVARLKRENNLYPVSAVKSPRTTQSDPHHPVVANHLNREFEQTHAHAVWVGDITYLALPFTHKSTYEDIIRHAAEILRT